MSKNSKRFFILFTSIMLLSAIVFTACGGGPKEANVQEVYDKLIATNNFQAMVKVPEREMQDVFGINTEKLKQHVFYMSENSAVNADEIAIFEVSDAAYAEELENICKKRVERQREVASSYAPEELSKLKPVEVRRVGNYVYYVIGNNYDSLAKILKDNIG